MERLIKSIVKFFSRRSVSFADATEVLNRHYKPLINKAFAGTLTKEEIERTSSLAMIAVEDLQYGKTED